MATSPWRIDMASNTGADTEGYHDEVFLAASAVVHFHETMRPRRRSDPAADPRSALKVLEGVRRRHIVKGYRMVATSAVTLAVKGMCREYVEKYGVDTLVPERKLPFTDRIMNDMFLAPNGSTRGGLTLDWNDYFWVAARACFCTLAEEGSRKDEVAKESESTPPRKGYFTFKSLVWVIGGVELHRAPTREELLTLREGDGVLLKHGVAKNDPFGSHFAATPSFLAYRAGDARCACCALAALELRAGLSADARATTPLFGPRVGDEFTHYQLDTALELLLVEGAHVSEPELENYSVHSFRIFAACALLAADAPKWIIKRLLRWRGDDSLKVYARLNNSEWAHWTNKMVSVSVNSTISSRLTYMDFSAETQQRFQEVATAMLSLNANVARVATGEL